MAGQLRNALRDAYRGISGCNNYQVTCEDNLESGAELVFRVKIQCTAAQKEGSVTPFPLIGIDGSELQASSKGRRLRASRSTATVAIKTVINPTALLEGTFQLTLGSEGTEPIAIAGDNFGDRAAAELENTLATYLRQVKETRVFFSEGVRTEGDREVQFYRYDITFQAPQGKDFAEFKGVTENTARLRGTNATLTIKTLQDGVPGSRLYQPIPDEMLEVARETSSASVRTNGVNAMCTDQSGQACAFGYDASLTPVITAVSNKDGDHDDDSISAKVSAGDMLQIDGNNLKYQGGKVEVTLGGATCAIKQHSDTVITCTVQHTTHGLYHPRVIVAGTGLARVAATVAKLKYDGEIDSAFPLTTGVRGGAMLTLTGTGFALDGAANKVTVGGLPCPVVSSTYTELKCITPQMNHAHIDYMQHGGVVVDWMPEDVGEDGAQGYDDDDDFVAVTTVKTTTGRADEPPSSSPKAITITQTGDFQWTMASDADGVVDTSTEHFQTLTIKQGTVVNFVGKVEETHSFSVKSSSSGDVVVGPTDVATGDASVEYNLTWTASEAGTFEYFCKPHESFMKGTIVVEETKEEAPETTTAATTTVADRGSSISAGEWCADGKTFCVKWEAATESATDTNGDEDFIRFTVSGLYDDRSGAVLYASLGIKGADDDATTMLPADIATCIVNRVNDKFEVLDMYAVADRNKVKQSSDRSQDLTVISAGAADGVFQCTFERPLAATESSSDRAIAAGETNFVWAIGTLNKLIGAGGTMSAYTDTGAASATFVASERRRGRRSDADAAMRADVVVGLFDNEKYESQLEYSWAATPSVAAVSPKAFSSAKTAPITVDLEDFRGVSMDASAGCTPTMSFVSPSGLVRTCDKVQINGTVVSCVLAKAEPLPASQQPKMFPRLQLCANGQMVVAHPTPEYSFIDIALRVDSSSPNTGSIAGGTRITVLGAGFVGIEEKMVRSALTYNYLETMATVDVQLADRKVPCAVVASNFSVMECITAFPETINAVATTGIAATYSGGGRNAAISISVNDYFVAGCGKDKNKPTIDINATGSVEYVYSDHRKTFKCEFDYIDGAKLTSVYPTSGVGETEVTIEGSGFNAEPTVTFGAEECKVTSYDATTISCTVPAMVVGQYIAVVSMPQFGFAAHPAAIADAVQFESKAVVSSVEPRASSLKGGVVITVAGQGFQPSVVGAGNVVTIGGNPAHLVESNLTHIIAVAPVGTAGNAKVAVVVSPIPEGEPINYYGQIAPVIFEEGADGPISWGIDTSADAATRTIKKGTEITWKLDMDAEPHSIVTGSGGAGDGRIDSGMLNATAEWSYTFDAVGTFAYFCDPHAFMKGTITVVDDMVSRQQSFDAASSLDVEYSSSVTPIVTSVSPASGREGDAITIRGSALTPDADGQLTEVLIGAEECLVEDPSKSTATKIVCRLGPTPGGTHTIYVTVGGKGTADFFGKEEVVFSSAMEVTGLSTAHGSFGGGTLLTLSGSGFGGGDSNGGRRLRRDGAWGGWIIYDRDDMSVNDEELGTKINLCNTECRVVASAYDEVSCITESLHSVESITLYNDMEPTKFEPEAFITSNDDNSTAEIPFNGDFAAHFKGEQEDGSWVGVDLGEGTRAVLTRFRFFPVHQHADKTDGGVFETSADMITWNNIGTVELPHQGWNWVTVDPTTQEHARYIRYIGPDGSSSIVTKLEFYGYTVAAGSSCTVKVSSTVPMSHPSLGPMATGHEPLEMLESSEVFNFLEDQTGVVTSVSPRYGSSLGGELVTINGTNLATTVDDAAVVLNGKECIVQSAAADGSEITCITTPRGHRNKMQPVSLKVSNAALGMGDAMSKPSVQYRYLDRWSALNTWLDDQPPVHGDFVTIPEDQTILLDESPPQLSVLLVLGMLVFDRKDLNLDASYILVQGGTMEIGTEDDPFLQQVTITLHGDRRKNVELPFIGAKVLAVADKGGFTTHGQGRGVDVPDSQRGVLDIHGKPRLRTWTKVAESAEKGAKTIVTSEPTDFAPGEKIVVTAPHQEVTVDKRIDEYTFTIVEPLAQKHTSEEWSTEGHEIDMRFEVALLSRNIIIQGAGLPRGDGSPTIADDGEVASEKQLFGAHTGAFHGGFYRVENTELRHCGQSGVLGRYCMHFHVCGDNPAPNSYIKSNSIHHSFQRATTVHGTHHALVQNNVAYHVMGHTYFVEDGDETFNTFDNNIGIFTKPHHMMLKSDKEPSTFWTAIPTNFWRNNIATDSSHRGAWFELTNQGITLEFFNNTFHHNSGIGFRNYPNYSPPSPQYFHNNTYFRNGGNGLFYKKGGDNHHVHSKFAQNGVDLFWKKYSTHESSRLIPNVKDCAFWGGRGAQAIFAPSAEYWYVNGSKFMNYESGAGTISACAGCCSPVTFKQGAYTYRFERLEFENVAKRTQWTCPYKQILYDLDGTLSEQGAGSTVLPSYKFNEWDGECETDKSGVYSGGRAGMVCNNKVRVRRLQIWDNQPRELDDKKISLKKSVNVAGGLSGKLTDRFGNSDEFGMIHWEQYHKTGLLYEGKCDDAGKANDKSPLDFSGCNSRDDLDWINYRQAGVNGNEWDGWAIPVVTQHDYFADVDWHIDFQKLTVRWSEPFYFDEPYNIPLVDEESVMLRWPYVDYRYRFRVQYASDKSIQLPWYDHKPVASTGEPKQLTRFDNFGEGLILREDDSLRTTECCGEWKVAMNPWAGIDADKGQKQLQFNTEPLQCGPDMCSLPGDNAACMTGGKWDEAKCPCTRWSEASTWYKFLSLDINTVDAEMTGNLPIANARIEIPRLQCVILDTNTPALDKLVVAGRLKFDGNDRQLDVNRMLVWGFLEIGTVAAPYPAHAEIVLHGVRTSATLVATDQHFLGNKNLAIFGDVQAHGTPTTTSWTELKTTGKAGSNVIEVLETVDWKVGDTILITGSEYPTPYAFEDAQDGGYLEDYVPHQSEQFQIGGISGKKVTLVGGMKYTHFAENINIGKGDCLDCPSVRLATHVGLLNRNVVIRGDTTDTPVDGERNWYTGYGGHIVVGEVNYGSEDELNALKRAGEKLGVTQKLGTIHVSNVQFDEMGKLASEHGAITFRYFSDLKSAPTNRIEDCAFTKGWNYAIVTDKSFDVEILGNVISRTFRTAIDIDVLSKGTVIKNNLISHVLRSPDDYNPDCANDQSCRNNPFGGVFLWNKDFAELSGNVVAGSEDTGFTIYPVDECGTADTASLRVHGNTAYGTLVGMYILDDAAGSGCRMVHSTKVWKNSHIGIVTVDQSKNLKIVSAVVADNHEGISLNFVQRGWKSLAAIEDSVILGSTPASDTTVCTASMNCRAMQGMDTRGLACNSVFGNAWRRVGIVMPQYTNLKKTCEGQGTGAKVGGNQECRPPNRVFRTCSLPWDARFGNPDVQHAVFEITRTTFAYWKANDCGRKSRAIALNPTQPDLAPETHLSELSWDDATVDATARFQLGDSSYQTNEAVACTSGMCDAVNYFKLHDLDGSTIADFWADGSDTSNEAFTMVSSYNPAQARGDKCRGDPLTKSIVCRDFSLSRLVLEVDPPRFVTRRVGPATIKKFADTLLYEEADDRTYFSVAPFPQGCSCQKHFAQFTFDVEPGYAYEVTTMGVLQDKNRIGYFSKDPKECIVAQVFFNKPQVVEVVEVATGKLVAPVTTGVKPTITDPAGTNMVHPQERRLYLTMCGSESGDSVYWISYGSQVLVTATLKMTIDEFFATESKDGRTKGTDAFVSNIATLLQIDVSQIKVTCVHPPGKPCIPLEAERRARRATDDGAVATFANTTEEESEFLVVEFEISVAEPTLVAPSSAAPAEWCGDACTVVDEEDANVYLSRLVYYIMEQQDGGLIADALEDQGYIVADVVVKYDDLLTFTTITTTTTTTNATDIRRNFTDFDEWDLDTDGELSWFECRQRLYRGCQEVDDADISGKFLVKFGQAIVDEVRSGTAGTPLFDPSANSTFVEMDVDESGGVAEGEWDAWFAALPTTAASEGKAGGMGGGGIAAVVITLLIVAAAAFLYARRDNDEGAADTAASYANPGFEMPQYSDKQVEAANKSNPNWQQDDGSLQFVKGKAKAGGDEESYFSKRSRAQLAKDSLMGPRNGPRNGARSDESCTDEDVSVSRRAVTTMPTFVEVKSKVQPGGDAGGRLNTNPNYEGGMGTRQNGAGVEYAVPYN